MLYDFLCLKLLQDLLPIKIFPKSMQQYKWFFHKVACQNSGSFNGQIQLICLFHVVQEFSCKTLFYKKIKFYLKVCNNKNDILFFDISPQRTLPKKVFLSIGNTKKFRIFFLWTYFLALQYIFFSISGHNFFPKQVLSEFIYFFFNEKMALEIKQQLY